MAIEKLRRFCSCFSRGSLRDCTLALPLLLSLFAFAGTTVGAAGPHGSVDLIAEQSSVQPGAPFWVGLHFQLEKGWHIYWSNPGDSGEPARIKWSVTGFEPGAIQWPTPHRIKDHTLVDYGYDNDVLLPVEISPDAKDSKAGPVQLNATVNWLVCRDICIPGRAALALTVPIRTGTPERTAAALSAFAQARADLPRPAPKAWTVTAKLDARRIVLNVDTGKRETAASFFPLEPNQIENAAPQKANPTSRGVQLDMQKSDQMLKTPSRMSGVLVLGSGPGYVVEAPVTASK